MARWLPWTFLSSTRSRANWRSRRLSWWWMTAVIFVELGFIGAIAALTRVSQTRDGIVNVQEDKDINTFQGLFSRQLWESQLRWTFLPGLAMSLLALGYGTIVSASTERQPYIELNKPATEAKSVKLTLLLDYPSQPMVYSWIVAVSNGHNALGCALLVLLVTGIFIAPLGSNLFRSRAVQRSVPIALSSPSGFDILAINISTDLQPAINVASAVHQYGASPPEWTTEEYAINPYAARHGQLSGVVISTTDLYYADLDCQSIPRSLMDLSIGGSNIDNLDNVLISFIDRGCNITGQGFGFSSSVQHIADTWWYACDGLDPSKDRVGVFVSSVSRTAGVKLEDLITVSCIPSYHNATASVEMQFQSDTGTQVMSVNHVESSVLTSFQFRSLHYSLGGYKQLGLGLKIETDSFGATVYQYALKIAGDSALTAENVMSAVPTVYRTMFAALTEANCFVARQRPQLIGGEQLLSKTRLYVQLPVAYALLSLLGLIVVCSGFLFWISLRKKSILCEDPVGLLGKASILFGSDCTEFIEEFRNTHSPDEGLMSTVETKYNVKKAKCWYGAHPGTSKQGVRIKDLKEL